MTSAQFEELKALLQPGFELSTLMLEEYKADRERRAAYRAREEAEMAASLGGEGQPAAVDLPPPTPPAPPAVGPGSQG